MKIGITGAFGFLGSNLVSKLISEGYGKDDIIAYYSNTRKNPVFDSDAVTPRHIDIRDYDDVMEKTSDLDILLHFAGMISYSKNKSEKMWITNVIGTRNILEAVRLNGIKKLVYVSSINVLGALHAYEDGVLGDETNDVYDKNCGNPNFISSPEQALNLVERAAAGDFEFLENIKVGYFDSKLAAFELVKKYHLEHNLPAVTVFPGTVVGPGDIHKDISELIDNVYRGKLKVTFSGGTSFVDVRDCADGVLLCMKNAPSGECYILSGRDEDNLSYKDFMKLIAESAEEQGVKTGDRFLPIPHFLGVLVCSIAEFFNPRSSITTGLAVSGKMKHYFSSDKARRELSYVNRWDLRQSIKDCYDFSKLN